MSNLLINVMNRHGEALNLTTHETIQARHLLVQQYGKECAAIALLDNDNAKLRFVYSNTLFDSIPLQPLAYSSDLYRYVYPDDMVLYNKAVQEMYNNSKKMRPDELMNVRFCIALRLVGNAGPKQHVLLMYKVLSLHPTQHRFAAYMVVYKIFGEHPLHFTPCCGMVREHDNQLLKGIHIRKFTAKQNRICQLLIAGNTSKQIACLLNVTERDINKERHKMRKKTGTSSTIALIMFAQKFGLIHLQ